MVRRGLLLGVAALLSLPATALARVLMAPVSPEPLSLSVEQHEEPRSQTSFRVTVRGAAEGDMLYVTRLGGAPYGRSLPVRPESQGLSIVEFRGFLGPRGTEIYTVELVDKDGYVRAEVTADFARHQKWICAGRLPRSEQRRFSRG